MNLEDIKLKNFVELSNNEKLMVLSWRNDKSIRKWMYDSQIISENNHLNFIDNLINDKNNIYFLVCKNDQNIGVIYFNEINYENKTCYFGLYANPFEKIAGVGRILEEICIKYTFEVLKLIKLKLEVFEENEKARALYKKYKFQEVGKKTVNDKKVICMELKNEDR